MERATDKARGTKDIGVHGNSLFIECRTKFRQRLIETAGDLKCVRPVLSGNHEYHCWLTHYRSCANGSCWGFGDPGNVTERKIGAVLVNQHRACKLLWSGGLAFALQNDSLISGGDETRAANACRLASRRELVGDV